MNDAARERLAAFMAQAGRRSLVMGILNVTPDSFSDGGRFGAPEHAVAEADLMVEAGAAVIDVGGESTRPGFTPVPAEEELRRIVPVIGALAERLPVPVSVDTTKAAVARRAVALGACMVNDIWGFQSDPGMADAVAEGGAAAVLMHNRASKDDGIDIVDDMRRFFDRSLDIAARAGIPRHHLVLDPGIGFGKTPRQQLIAIKGIAQLLDYGLPVLIGLSRKSFLGRITGAGSERRLPETIAANLAAANAGATIFRVHDVAEHVAALKVFDAIDDFGRAMTQERTVEVALGLGSNIGDKPGNIARALQTLEAAGLAHTLAGSGLYRTAPWGPVEQDWYVNACAVGRTALPPLELLARIKALETALGRVETVRWGPRVIDIDLLYYGDVVLNTPALTLPHPELLKRAFVLVPLAELRPERRVCGTTIGRAAAVIDRSGVQKLS